MYFLLSLVGIAAGIYCIVMKTVWWVTLIAFGSAVIFLLVGFYKIGDAMEKSQAEEKKKLGEENYPPQIAHCLSLSQDELIDYAKKYAFVLRVCELSRYNENKNLFVFSALSGVYHSDDSLSPAAREFCRLLDVDDKTCEEIMKKGLSEEWLKTMADMTNTEKEAVLSLSAAAVVAGGMQPQYLAYYERLLNSAQ